MPTNAVEARDLRRADLPGRGLSGRHRPGLRRRHADPADQRLRRARERRQGVPAADRPRDRRPGRARRRGRSSRSSSARWTCTASVLKDMREAAAHGRDDPPHVQPRRPADRHRRQVRHRRVRDARPPGPAAVPLVVRGLRAEGPDEDASDPQRPEGGREGDRSSSSLPSPTTRGPRATPPPRSSSTTCSSTTASRRTTGTSTSSSAATSTSRTDATMTSQDRSMGVIRAEPARVSDWAARSIGAAWRAFDLQLAAYAALLATIGLAMAYTTASSRARSLLEAGHDLPAGADVDRDRPDRVPRRDRLRLHWLQDVRVAAVRAPARLAGADARDRRRRRRLRALGLDRAVRSSSSASSPRS